MIEILNWLQVILTMIGVSLVAIKGDKCKFWIVLVFGSITGIVYFSIVMDLSLLSLYVFYLVMNLRNVWRTYENTSNE